MATLTDKEKNLAGKIALFLFTLLTFLKVTVVIDLLNEIVEQAKVLNSPTPPALKDVGDTLLDALATGGTMIEDSKTQTTFEKWIGIIKGGWDAIEGGAGSVISLFKALIAGHEAKVANQAAQKAE